jgi:pantetheine-phosphate adenylyltransferase
LKKIAIYPGTFDPVTNGHIDIIERCSKLFNQVIVAILLNPDKSPLFTVRERVAMLKEVMRRRFRNVTVGTFDGLLVEYAVKQKATVIVRGIRAISDYEYELQMALMNRRLEPRIETVFMLPAESYSYLSSKLIREIFVLGGSVKGLVPDVVEHRLHSKNKGPLAARWRD